MTTLEFAARVLLAALCWATVSALAFGLMRGYLWPRPLFLYMLGAFTVYAVVRTIIPFVGNAGDPIWVWLSPLQSVSASITILSVLLLILHRIREARTVSNAAYNPLGTKPDTLGGNR